ncbi:sugar ABC transporter ATP-binding protein [Protaetiibacter mangrovi]|uniref:Sugar ABC transporter ATP-binding protein n=1 Tax=Protaetiibacter mangrovi TaxID=2970926 RepID=A0ABT1ZDY4_9MICO|nr:sugar ABC transporter ATP-binding protein [Protaetiibacter mangrovi]MCS0498889.1 sugar ABC transporter ATP-binding protein [Protaetiibacter mangrovi]
MIDAAQPTPLISARGLTKSFGAVRALRGVGLDILPGQVHGLVGANGAGKSTFLNMLAGVVTPDGGELLVDGRPTVVSSPRHAADLGFAFIYQELALVPEFSAIDNMTIGVRPTTFLGLGDARRRKAIAREVAARLDLRFPLDKPVRDLSIAERGLVAIGRALVGDARFVSMDEPTASLSDVECERLFDIVRELTASGVAVAYVSHRLDEIEELCDAVTVFKDGQVVASHERGGYTRDDLVLGITGARDVRETVESPDAPVSRDAEVVLSVRGLARGPRVHDVSFDLRRGEILGLAGVVGAGRTETLRLIFGAERPVVGEMTLGGAPYRPRSVADAIGRGVALVPEERRSQALVMDESVLVNTKMGGWRSARAVSWLPFVADGRARATARTMVERLGIKTGSINSAVRTLSGGNQQKVVFARWLSRDVGIMLLDEPTRGVDVGARRQIWATAEEFAAAGGAVVVVCSELEELAVCHRVVVMVEGRTVGEIAGPGVTEADMLEAIYTQERTSS